MSYQTRTRKGGLVIHFEDEHIYALVDPRTEQVRYIGRTMYPEQRFAQHVSGYTKPTKVWVSELKTAGLEPRMVILETTNELEASAVERKTIHRYRKELGTLLLNRNCVRRADLAKNISMANGAPFLETEPV